MEVSNSTQHSASSSESSTSTSKTAFISSAFASVSEMASKSILVPSNNKSSVNNNSVSFSPNSSTANSSAEKESNFVASAKNSLLSRALSIKKAIPNPITLATQNTTTTTTAQETTENTQTTQRLSDSSPKSSLTDSISATASSVFNNLKSPFDFSDNNSPENHQHTSSPIRSTRQARFFPKLEGPSLSLPASIFGYNLQTDSQQAAAAANKLSNSPIHTVNHNSHEMIEEEGISLRTYSEGDGSKSAGGSVKRKTKPAGTLEYIVLPGETIEKIALKWNTIPSEIQHLNRLVTRTIFPGQTLYVPDPDYVPPPLPPPVLSPAKNQLPDAIINELNNSNDSSHALSPTHQQTSTTTSTFNIFKWRTSSAPKPGHVEPQKLKAWTSVDVGGASERRRSFTNSRHTITEEEAKQLDEECMQRFIKVNCKIVTRSKGCVKGVLIITPSALMFDPLDNLPDEKHDRNMGSSSSDPKSPSVFDTSSPGLVNNTSGNNDSLNVDHAHSRTNSSSGGVGSVNGVGTTIYDEASAIVPVEIISNVIMYEDLSLTDVEEYFEYTSQLNGLDACDPKAHHHNHEPVSAKTSNVSFTLHDHSSDHNAANNDSKLENDNNTSKEEVAVSDNNNEVFVTTTAVSVESNSSMNKELLEQKTSSESGCSNSNLISCYLCIKVNKNKDFMYCPLDRKMKNKLTSEFWFQINDDSTDKICAFFLQWKSDTTYALSPESVPRSHFQLVKADEKLADMIAENLTLSKNASALKLNKSFSSTNRLINKDSRSFVKDWEIVNLQELESKLRKEMEIENEYKTLPTLNTESTIMKEEHLRKLNVNLIPRAAGYNWTLSFSTDQNGFSLNTLYRQLANVETPCLVVVMDTNRNVFGAMASGKLNPSEYFYGTGETFLFTFYPGFKIFKWTGENNFFIRGNTEGIGFGCAEGYHGLWFDGNLLHGHSQRSKTFDNDPLSSSEDFTIAAIEVWSFSDFDD